MEFPKTTERHKISEKDNSVKKKQHFPPKKKQANRISKHGLMYEEEQNRISERRYKKINAFMNKRKKILIF